MSISIALFGLAPVATVLATRRNSYLAKPGDRRYFTPAMLTALQNYK